MSENETAILGAAILDPTTIDISSGIVSPQDFTHRALGQAFALLCDLRDAGSPIDASAIVARLRAAKLLDAVGGRAGIAGWAVACPNTRHVKAYAESIKADATRRRLGLLARELGERAGDTKADTGEILNWLDGQLARHRSGVTEGPQMLASAMDDVIRDIRAMKSAGRASGIPTGLTRLDGALGGLYPNELVILAARPSIGKSAMGCQIGIHNALLDRQVLFVSLEMSGRDIATRTLAAAVGYEVRTLRAGRVEDQDLADMDRHRDEMAGVGFHIWSARAATMAKIRAAARVQQATTGLELLVVDYLGLIQSTDRRRPRWEQVTETSGELKSLALELGVPVLALCQLGREAEKGKPGLEHLRDSGAIEQDADVVLLLHRESREATLATLDVAKARNGCCGSVEIAFDPAATRFGDVGATDCYEQYT